MSDHSPAQCYETRATLSVEIIVSHGVPVTIHFRVNIVLFFSTRVGTHDGCFFLPEHCGGVSCCNFASNHTIVASDGALESRDP